MKIRYRCEAGSSSRAKTRFHHVQRLGKLFFVRGYRFTSTRSWRDEDGERHTYTTNHERVLVKGENGTARFDGVCWNYSGEGPRALVELLIQCGLARQQAEQVAFTSQRHQHNGTDWEVQLQVAQAAA